MYVIMFQSQNKAQQRGKGDDFFEKSFDTEKTYYWNS